MENNLNLNMPDILGFSDRRADNPDYVRTRTFDGEPVFKRGKREVVGWVNLARSKKVERYRRNKKTEKKPKSKLEKLLEAAQIKLDEGRWEGNFALITEYKPEKGVIGYECHTDFEIDGGLARAPGGRNIGVVRVYRLDKHYIVKFLYDDMLITHNLRVAKRTAHKIIIAEVEKAQRDYWEWYHIYESQLKQSEHGVGEGLLPIKDKTKTR